MRPKGPNILIFPGFAPCGAKAAPVWERQIESGPMAKSKSKPKSKPKPKSATKPKSGTPDAQTLTRIADALERLAPRPNSNSDFDSADAFIWQAQGSRLVPVPRVNRVQMTLLKGIDRVRDTLMENTERFAKGLPANNALLWGARGMGKSSLVKAAHAHVVKAEPKAALKLVEIHREEIESLPALMTLTRSSKCRFIIFCDDLSFDASDTSYKSLKAVLEGGVEGRPDNVLFYATSNRRHLLPRDMIDNERGTAINLDEARRIAEEEPLADMRETAGVTARGGDVALRQR